MDTTAPTADNIGAAADTATADTAAPTADTAAPAADNTATADNIGAPATIGAPSNIGAPANIGAPSNIGAPANNTTTANKTAPATANMGVPDRPAYLYAVSDCRGFVGAFYTMGLAIEGVVRKYAPTPFLIQRFPVAPGAFDRVWCVIRRGDDSIAFMSNDKAEATRVQQLYAAVGLVYEDDVSYWEQPAGAIIPPARERLESLARAHLMYAPDAVSDAEKNYTERDLARVEAMMAPNPDGPIAKMLREMELITIMDCVEPIDYSVEPSDQEHTPMDTPTEHTPMDTPMDTPSDQEHSPMDTPMDQEHSPMDTPTDQD